jgi:hypothetical protein
VTDQNPKSERKYDPETGLPLTKKGILNESTGSGSLQKIKITPPAEMQYMVENGLAPSALPNWNRDDPESLWYCGYRKFSPERREIFLTKLAQTGRVIQSAMWAGINESTVRNHRKADPEFDTACKLAEQMYHESVVVRLTHQALVGQIDERKDKEGNVISRRVSYEQQLRIRLLQRADPSYQDSSKQEVSVVGGAVVVPAPIDSVESWDDVVRRHTGGGNSTGGSGGSLPSPDSGPKALAEGRVVKRGQSEILEADGTEVGDEPNDVGKDA